MFGADGALWFLMPVGDQDQLFRMAVGGAAGAGQQLQGRRRRLQARADRATASSSGPTATCAAPTSTAPACRPSRRPASGRTYDQLFIRHWDTWAEPGVRSRLFGFAVAGGKLAGAGVPLTGNLVGDTPSKPFGGGEEIAFSPDGRTVYFALREAGRIEPCRPTSTSSRRPADGSAPPVNLTDANDATDNLPTVSPDGRTLAYFAMARPSYEADRQVLMLRDLATRHSAAR